MLQIRLILGLGITLLLTITHLVQADIIYQDGGIHFINTNISGTVYVNNGQQGPTTLNVTSEGSILGNDMGNIGGLGAAINASYSIVNINGGSIIGGSVGILGGTAAAIYASYSIVNINDGSIIGSNVGSGGGAGLGILGYNSSVINIYGGHITGGNVGNYGGGISFCIAAYNFSTINIYGGSMIRGSSGSGISKDIGAYNGSTIKIYGTGFNYSYGPINSISGNLTGTLSDGTLLDAKFYQNAPGLIVLIPEPATILLLSLGWIFLKKRKC